MFRFIKGNRTIHYIPNLAFYSVKFPTVKILSFRGHLMFLTFIIEFAYDFKINMKTILEKLDFIFALIFLCFAIYYLIIGDTESSRHYILLTGMFLILQHLKDIKGKLK